MARPLVLFVAPRNNLYGASRSMLDLIHGLPERGFDVHVALQTPGPLNEIFDRERIPWTPIQTHRWIGKPRGRIRRVRNRIQDARTAARLAQLAQQKGAALIHTNTLSSPLGGLVARQSGIPHLWHMREAVDTEPGSVFAEGLETAGRFINETADRVVCISKFLAEATTRYVASDKIRCLYNGLLPYSDQALPLPPRAPLDPKQPIQLLLVGAVSPRKGHTEAILAASELRSRGYDIRLVFAGDGSSAFTTRLKNLAQATGMESMIEWLGYVDPTPYYRDCSISLACGIGEPLGRVAIESLANGIPTVAIRSGGLPEVIDDGETGWLYEGSSYDLADAIAKVLHTDPHHRDAIREEGRYRAYQRFNKDRYCDDMVSLYREMGIG